MFPALFDFLAAWLVTSTAISARRTAASAALAAERAAWSEDMRRAYQAEQVERKARRAGRWRFFFIAYGVLMVIGLLLGYR
jgi:hypothetical protein